MPAKGKKRTAAKKKEEMPPSESQTADNASSSKETNVQALSSPKSKEVTKEITSYFPKSPSPKKPGLADEEESPGEITSISKKTTETPELKHSSQETERKDVQKDEEEGSSGTKKEEQKEQKGISSVLSSPGESAVKAKKKRMRQKNKDPNKEIKISQTVITEHFQVRRSQRKCKSTVEEEKRLKLENAVLKNLEEGVEIKQVEGKGRGVFATQSFSKGDFVCEYAGELINYNTAKEREQAYSQNTDIGCYMYYFNFKNKKYCVDATKESGRLGRLLNHSVNGNCTTKLISIKDRPYLILVTSQNVEPGEELLYDYGERSKDVVESHPWLKA